MEASKQRPTFTLRYLLLLLFCWAMALAILRQILPDSNGFARSDYRGFYYLLLPIALGPAYGGLVLKMTFGFYAGLTISGMMFFVVFWISGP